MPTVENPMFKRLRNETARGIAFAMLVTLPTIGCSTWRTRPVPEQALSHTKPTRLARVRLVNDDTVIVRGAVIRGDSVVSTLPPLSPSIALSNVRSIEVHALNGSLTMAFVLVGAAVFAIATGFNSRTLVR